MICKYCGSPLSGSICTSCKKANSLSYTSHELATLLGHPPALQNTEKQLSDTYESGFFAGQQQGYENGFAAAQQKSMQMTKRQKHSLMIIAACCAVVLAVFCSTVTGVIAHTLGNKQGVSTGKQEQQIADQSSLSEFYQQGYKAGHKDGYQIGYRKGQEEAPTPSPPPTPTPTPEPSATPTASAESIMLQKRSKGTMVRQLQQRLIELGYLAANEDDGDFGSKTEKAVKAFQADYDLPQTGIVDQGLWDQIMSEPVVSATPAAQPVSEVATTSELHEDIELGGETVEGTQADNHSG